MQKKDFLNKEGLKYFYNGFKNIVDDIVTNKILEDNKKKYPIGKIIFSTEDTNPADYLGFGTWEAWGAGRVPVGVDVSQTEFNAPETVGGEKTHVLTSSEMPTHNHNFSATTSKANLAGNMYNMAVQSGSTAVGGNGIIDKVRTTGSIGYATESKSGNNADYTDTVRIDVSHTHTVSGRTQNSGSGEGHNNLQPYITCYMWKRTA